MIFPRTSFLNHKRIFERNEFILPSEFSKSKFNFIENKIPGSKKGIVASGVSYCYAKEALEILGEKNIPVLKIGTPYPFPSDLAKSFLADAEEVLVIEELDPVIENELLKLCGKIILKIKSMESSQKKFRKPENILWKL